MQSSHLTGLFGKLPAHGDFIYRDLPPGFINVWDQWLQGYIGASKEQLGEAWLDIYLTSPIWRFAFADGVVDSNSWAGIVLPSVDRVGRYFPFSVATRLPAGINSVEFICARPNWYQAMEDAALAALHGQIKLDELVEELNDSNPMQKYNYKKTSLLQGSSPFMVRLPTKESSPAVALPSILDGCLSSMMQSYSVWSTAGSERIAPCLFVSKSLPQLSGISAMMDGNWAQWNWQEPFSLAT